jgi:acyl carrier protein
MEIEGELDITISNDETDAIRTVGDVVRAVDSCLAGKNE